MIYDNAVISMWQEDLGRTEGSTKGGLGVDLGRTWGGLGED